VRMHIHVFSPVLPRRFGFVVARIYEFLFTKFDRVWFVGGVLLLWEGRVYRLQISSSHLIPLSVNYYPCTICVCCTINFLSEPTRFTSQFVNRVSLGL